MDPASKARMTHEEIKHHQNKVSSFVNNFYNKEIVLCHMKRIIIAPGLFTEF